MEKCDLKKQQQQQKIAATSVRGVPPARPHAHATRHAVTVMRSFPDCSPFSNFRKVARAVGEIIQIGNLPWELRGPALLFTKKDTDDKLTNWDGHFATLEIICLQINPQRSLPSPSAHLELFLTNLASHVRCHLPSFFFPCQFAGCLKNGGRVANGPRGRRLHASQLTGWWSSVIITATLRSENKQGG